jgi:hypothetical protein
LVAALVIAGCSSLRPVDLSIPQDLLTADTEESLLSSMSLLDGCSLAGTWKYESEKDPEYWGYMIIEVVLNRVRGTLEHHQPHWTGESRMLFLLRGNVNPDGLSATARMAAQYTGHPPSWPASLRLTPNDGGLNLLSTQPHEGGVRSSRWKAKKIQSGQCQKSVLYVARIEDWAFRHSSIQHNQSEWDAVLIERNRQRELCIAAHQGDAEAQYTLGNNYKFGLSGTTPDAARAYLWYSLAGDFRDAIQFKETEASAMNFSQLAEAERLVANWRPNPDDCEFESP